MKKLAILSAAAAAVGLAALQPVEAEARNGRRTAAVVGAVGGFAAGALIGGALSHGYAAPSYGYAPAYGYGYGYGYAPVYPATTIVYSSGPSYRYGHRHHRHDGRRYYR